MSEANSIRRSIRRIDRTWWLLALVLVCSSAHALKSDRTQVIKVYADHQEAQLGDNGQVTLTGHVRLDQGTLHVEGAKAVGYEDANNVLQRVVVTGAAKFRQKLDNGSLVNGSADKIDYLASENTVILTGNANVVQQGRGSYHGAKLTYNTDSGHMVGEGGKGGQVHMTFQPKNAPAKPAAGKSTPAQAATTGTSGPAPSAASTTSGPAPASATTSGNP